MVEQIGKRVERDLSKYLCGFRKGYKTQYASVALLEKWKVTLEKNVYAVQLYWTCQKRLIPLTTNFRSQN